MNVGAGNGVRVKLFLVGDFRAETPEGHSLLPVSRKARALLCIIGMARPLGALRAVAGTLLWSAKNRDAVANSLRQALSELQPLLLGCGRPYMLATKRGRLVIDPDSTWIDVLDMPADQLALIDQADPANTLCRDLRGISIHFDGWLDRLWAEVGVRRELGANPAGRGGSGGQRIVSDFSRLYGHPALGQGLERLERFPPTLGPGAEVASHQLGWRMAVMPFRSLGAPLGRGIALGMAEEVSAALGRFRAPRLVATATFWDGASPAADCMSRCRTYQLDYIIDGNIQVIGDRVRVTVTLLDVVLNFEVIWSQRFEGTLDNLFLLQDRIASSTVAQVDPELFQRHSAQARSARTPIPEAHHALLTAITGIYRLERSKFMRARDLLVRAIELDGEFAAAHAWLAYWSIMAVGQGWAENGREVIELAGRSAERAVQLDPLDARALAIAGHVKAYLLHDVRSALSLHERAIELNPNLPIAWTVSALSKLYSGDHATGLRHAQTAQSLSPRDPHIFFVEHALMIGHHLMRELEQADEYAEAVLERHPHHASAIRMRLSILGHLGAGDLAAEHLTRLEAIEPGATVASICRYVPFQRDDDREYYAEGLRLAGVPAG